MTFNKTLLSKACILLFATLGSFSSSAQIHHERYQGKFYEKSGYGYQLKHNLKDGQWFFYEGTDSILRLEVNFQNNKKNGNEKVYDSEGKLWKDSYYKDGVLDGFRLTMHPSGYTLAKEYFKNGKLHGSQTYYNSRGLKHHTTIEYVDGLRNGKEIEYLYDSTWKVSQTMWMNGKRVGTYQEWFANGQIRKEGNYYQHSDYDYLYSYNNRDGDWKYWNENGELLKVEHWNKELLTGITEYKSSNLLDLSLIEKGLITDSCFGKYCIGDDITSYNRSEGSWTYKGNERYNSYRGDSSDRITLNPSFSDTLTVQTMFTSSPKFRTSNNIGIGSSIDEIIESGENVEVIIGTGNHNPWVMLVNYGIKLNLDEDTNLLFRYRNDKPELGNLRLKGYVTSMEMSKLH